MTEKTLRDEFAKSAMQALVRRELQLNSHIAYKVIAEVSYEIADAMLKARKERGE